MHLKFYLLIGLIGILIIPCTYFIFKWNNNVDYLFIDVDCNVYAFHSAVDSFSYRYGMDKSPIIDVKPYIGSPIKSIAFVQNSYYILTGKDIFRSICPQHNKTHPQHNRTHLQRIESILTFSKRVVLFMICLIHLYNWIES